MQAEPRSPSKLSLLQGGPAHRLQLRLGLIGPASPRLWRRVFWCVLLTWVPLLLLSAIDGLAFGSRVRLPFLHDFAAYARYLVAVPLLILAEGLVERRTADAAEHFVRSGLVPEFNRPRFDAAIASCNAWRDSVVAECVVLVLAGISVFAVSQRFPFTFSTWMSIVSESGHHRTLGGWWYLVVANSLAQFLMWRWIWRAVIWYRFLWLISKLELRLIPTHPDRTGGLGFVGDTQRMFWGIVLAISATSAGVLANEIVYGGVALVSYKFAIATYAVIVLVIFLAPLLLFTPLLVDAKDKGLREYGALASSHNHMFHRKWVHGENPAGDPHPRHAGDLVPGRSRSRLRHPVRNEVDRLRSRGRGCSAARGLGPHGAIAADHHAAE